MSVLKKRSVGAWHDPIAYAGLTGGPLWAAANDNRDASAGPGRFVSRAAGLLAALGLAGVLAGAALAWW